MLKLTLGLIGVLLLFGCAMNVSPANPSVAYLKQIEVVDTPYEIAKVQYYGAKNTYFIWEKNSPNVHILQNGKETNVVGGLGFAKENFQRLTDIAVGVDGGLYCLDELLRKLKKFDSVGTWLLDYDVSWIQEPTKFAIDRINRIVLFDDIQREFTFSSDLRPEEVFKFGKFQVTTVQQITVENDQIIVYEPGSNQTSFFSILGQYQESRQGQIISDNRGNLYRLDKNYITFLPSGQTAAASVNPYRAIYLFDPYLITITDNQVQRWLINYATRP